MILARRFFCRAFFRLIEKSCNVFLYNVKENLRAFDNSLKMEIDKSFFCGKRYDSSGDFVDIRRKDFRGLEQKSAIRLRLRNSVRFSEISIFRARIELNEERRFYLAKRKSQSESYLIQLWSDNKSCSLDMSSQGKP